MKFSANDYMQISLKVHFPVFDHQTVGFIEMAFSKLSANKMVYTSLAELLLIGLVKAKNLFLLLLPQQ